MKSTSVSSAQEAMWLEQNLMPDVPNNTATIWDVQGELNQQLFEQALQSAVNESTALLVNFRWDEDSLRMENRKPGSWEPFHVDVSSADQPDEAAREFLTQLVCRPFDLGADALFRLGTIKLRDGHHLACFIFHHILTDAYGVFSLFSQRLAAIYRALLSGDLVPHQAESAAGAAGDRETAYRSSPLLAADEQFWRSYLEDAGTPARLPTGVRLSARKRNGYVGQWDELTAPLGVSSYTVAVPASEVVQWQAVATLSGSSVGDLITASAVSFLERLCHTPKTMMSFTVNYRSGRIRQALGLYSNALPLTIDVSASDTFVELAYTVQAARLDVLEHAELNVSSIKRAAGHAGEARSPFGPVVNVVPFLKALDLSGAVGRFSGGTFGVPDEVRISTYSDGSGLDSDLYVRFDAPGAYYTRDDIAGLAEKFAMFLRAALVDPHVRTRDISVLDAREKAELLELSRGRMDDFNGMTAFDLIEQQAALSPHAVACVDGETALTYGQLIMRSGQVSHRLAEQGSGPGCLVAISVPKSIEFVVAATAVIKAGSAILWIDPNWPAEAVETLLADSKPALLLTVTGDSTLAITPMREAKPCWESSVFEVDEEPEVAAKSTSKSSENNWAYVANGNVVTNRMLVNALLWLQDEHRLDETDRVLILDAPWKIFWPLIAGSSLVIGALNTSKNTADAVLQSGATTVSLSPSLLSELVKNENSCRDLQRVLCSGEPLLPGVTAQFHKVSRGLLYNMYGPNGSVPPVLSSKCSIGSRTSLIGRPVWNARVFVLDAGLDLTPVGVAGEIYIAELGLIPDFPHQPDVTAVHSVPCPFGPAGLRMYRTGDMARWNSDAELEFAGRADQMVSINGYRTNPFELELALSSYDKVGEAAVTVHSDAAAGDSCQLIAYVVPSTTGRLAGSGDSVNFAAGLDIIDLRRFLAASLPENLIPASIQVLDSLPLTVEGTRDRAALPKPQIVRRVHRVAETAKELILAEVYSSVLGTPRVSLDDDFFSLGGDSISATRVVALARSKGLVFTARTVFECRTIAVLAEAATLSTASVTSGVARSADRVGPISLPPMARLFDELGPGLDRLAQWLVLTAPGDLDLDLLVGSVQVILDTHEILRCRLVDDQLSVRSKSAVLASECVKRVRCEGSWYDSEWEPLLRTEAAAAVKRISASAGRMLQFVWFEPVVEGPGRLVVAAHHLVMDGVSWQVLVADLATVFGDLRSKNTASLPPVGLSYGEWLDALAVESVQPARVAELDTWKRILAPPIKPVGSRPLSAELDLTSTAGVLRIEIDESETAELLTSLPAAFDCGVDDILLAALVIALAGRPGVHSGSSVVRLEGHGRQEELVPGADLSRTIGWFTTVYPVRFDLSGIDIPDAIAGGPSAAVALRRVKESRRVLPNQGIGYTLLRYVNEKSMSNLREYEAGDVGFNYLGRFAFDQHRGDSSATWVPAPEFAELVAAPHAESPMISALSLDSIVVGTNSGERLRAIFTYATGVISEDEVRELSNVWSEALSGIRAQAMSGASGLTPSEVPLVELSEHDLDEWRARFGRVSDVWPLAPLQQGMLFHSMLGDSASLSYQMQFAFRIEGPIDPERLRNSAQVLLDRHPNLRVAFVTVATGEHVQVVVNDVVVPFMHFDLSSEQNTETLLQELLYEERRRRFTPDVAPLLRFTLVTLAKNHCVLALTAHHVLFDGWSLPLIEHELLHQYANLGDTRQQTEHGYREFLRWQSQLDMDLAIDAWAAELSGVTQPTLVSVVASSVGDGEEPSQVEIQLSPRESAQVVRRSAECGFTPNVLVQGAWAIVLAQITGRADVVFGSSVTVRPSELSGVHSMVGMFTNTVPVRARCEPGQGLEDLLRTMQNAQARMMEHYHCGLGDIQRAAGLSELFDTIVLFESFPVDQHALEVVSAAANLAVTEIHPFAPTHYPLTLIAAADPLLNLSLQYHPQLMDRDTVLMIADQLARVLRCFALDPSHRIGAMPLVSETERTRMLRQWNDTAMQVPLTTVPEQFSRQAMDTPNAVALVVGGLDYSYFDLNELVNRIAHWLLSEGVGAGSRVVVSLRRSAYLVAALLAVGKTGACYVPVDPDHPAMRIQSVIDDCIPSLVLDQSRLEQANLHEFPTHNPLIAVQPASPAYTIYTSGSTGTPKGVVIGHLALTNFLAGMQKSFGSSTEDVWGAVTTIAFDIAAMELFLPLTTGARVVLADRHHLTDPQEMFDLIKQAGITIMQATPALWQMLTAHDESSLDGLRILTGGEALPKALAEKLCARGSNVFNLYGPTETTIWSTVSNVVISGTSSIGRPIANTQVFILDSLMRPVPAGTAGDLWIAGSGLALGYYGQPSMTASHFTANPFGPSGERMYRTGDLARWTRSGEVEFLGRSDFQIKLRGYRVEPGDVEYALTCHPAVSEAIASAQEGYAGGKILVAYVVPVVGAELPNTKQLQGFVRQRLPEYMVPAVVVPIAALPLTANGKLDRSSLPKTEIAVVEYRAPETRQEELLCDLFAEILRTDRIGVDDDFFALGGHSLLATRLATRVRAEMGIELPIRTLFAAPTVGELVKRWNSLSTSVRKPLRRITER